MSAGRDREKVKETKKLVKLALDDGWTEAEIGRKCRVSAEKVSAWKNGKARGRRHELKPLLDAFGWRLRRGKMRVYLVVDPDAGPQWEETEEGRQMLADSAELESLEENQRGALDDLRVVHLPLDDVRASAAEKASELDERIAELKSELRDLQSRESPEEEPDKFDFVVEPTRADVERRLSGDLARALEQRKAVARLAELTARDVADLIRRRELRKSLGDAPADLIERTRAHHDEAHCVRPAVVPGRVVFTHPFTVPVRAFGRQERVHRLPMHRWTIHFEPDSRRFTVVRQVRRRLSPTRLQVWCQSLSRALDGGYYDSHDGTQYIGDVLPALVDSPDDAARWASEIEPPMNLADLLAYVDASIHQPERPHSPNDEVTLPFLVRKALIEQGFDVPGVVFYSAD